MRSVRAVRVQGEKVLAPFPSGWLLSYWRYRTARTFDFQGTFGPLDALGLKRPRLLMDSGVYTARQKGAPIEPMRYAEWMAAQDWRGVLAGAIDIDWPPVPDVQRRHTALLRTVLGADVVWPVLHPYQRIRDVDYYCAEYPWCAVGSWGVGAETGDIREYQWNKEAREEKLRWYDVVHSRAERYGTKLHGLGIGSSERFVKPYEWASADASLISSCERYGLILVWDRERRSLCQPIRGAQKRQSLARSRLPLLLEQGIDPRRVVADMEYRKAVSVAAMGDFERFYAARNRHGFTFFVAEQRPKVYARSLANAVRWTTGGEIQ